ncbi:MAG: hypothetical protein ISS70_14070 [Phycisphaerae bacterium]|nr:hypothetical protein [Phycisphaerae bacterium]
MFVGHYGAAYLLKKRFSQVPLWSLFVSVQLVDILTFVLVPLGIERIVYKPVPNPFLRTSLEYVPYSHSLSSNVIIALAVFLISYKLAGKAWALALLIGSVSHWFLDCLVHVGDIPLFFDSCKVGFGLWRFSRTGFLLETAFLILASLYFLRGSDKIRRHVILIVVLVAGYMAMFLAPQAEGTPTQASVMSLTLYAVFAGLAYWAERSKPKQQTSALQPEVQDNHS